MRLKRYCTNHDRIIWEGGGGKEGTNWFCNYLYFGVDVTAIALVPFDSCGTDRVVVQGITWDAFGVAVVFVLNRKLFEVSTPLLNLVASAQ